MDTEIQEKLHRIESLFNRIQSDQGPLFIPLERNSTDSRTTEPLPQAPSSTTAPTRSSSFPFSDGWPVLPPGMTATSKNSLVATRGSDTTEREMLVTSINSAEKDLDTSQLGQTSTRSFGATELIDQILSGNKSSIICENDAAVWIRTLVSSVYKAPFLLI